MAQNTLRAVDDREESLSTGGKNGNGNGNGYDLHGRVSSIEAHLQYLATKEDISNLKTNISDLRAWILGGVLAGIGIAATITAIIIKAFV